MNIYFVRHGLTEWNVEGRYQGWSDTELTREGMAQAWKTGDFIAAYAGREGLRFAALYASPLRRAWRTAAAIADRTNLAPQPVPELAEMCGGAVEGLLLEQWQSLYPELIPAWADRANLDFGWPGGETRRAFRQRCLHAVDLIVARHAPDDNLIIVSHGGMIAAYLEATALEDPQGPRPYDIHNCSITQVRVDLGAPDNMVVSAGCLVSLNDVRHLEDMRLPEVVRLDAAGVH